MLYHIGYGDGWRPTQIWNKQGLTQDVENITGLEFNSDYFKNDGDATPSCGSYTISDEVTYDKHAFSTYTKKGYLGWRFCRQDNGDGNNPGMSFDPYSSDTVGSNEGWFKELGFMIEVRASGFQNCKIEILSDARTQTRKM